jgi:hypothetical protein
MERSEAALFASIGIAFLVLGILITLYVHRFGRWWNGLGFHLLKIAPWLNFLGMTREEAEYQFYDSWPLKGWWLFWVWGMRIMGVLLAAAGAVLILALVSQFLTRT